MEKEDNGRGWWRQGAEHDGRCVYLFPRKYSPLHDDEWDGGDEWDENIHPCMMMSGMVEMSGMKIFTPA